MPAGIFVVFASIYIEAVTQRCFFKKRVLKIFSQFTAEYGTYWNRTSARVVFYKYTTYLQQKAFFREICKTASTYCSKYRS